MTESESFHRYSGVDGFSISVRVGHTAAEFELHRFIGRDRLQNQCAARRILLDCANAPAINAGRKSVPSPHMAEVVAKDEPKEEIMLKLSLAVVCAAQAQPTRASTTLRRIALRTSLIRQDHSYAPESFYPQMTQIFTD